MIRAFHAYKTFFNPRSRLLLVGSHAGFERYVAMLHGLIARLDAGDVHLVGHVSNEELAAYYEIADVFVSASEHEGFCVPLIESFHMGVPVLAYAATAVPSTMDGAGVLYTNKDPMHVAALINAVVDDPEMRERIIDGQYAALDRLEARDFAGTLLRSHGSACWRRRAASTRRWHSTSGIRSSAPKKYDEIKQYRPAAFQALPPEPGPGSAGCPAQSSHDRQPVGSGRAQGRRDRRFGAPRAALLREMGHQSDLYAMTIDDDLRGDVIPTGPMPARRGGDLTIFISRWCRR